MSTAKIILNPYAKRWQARQRLPELTALLRELQVPHELVETSEPGHGIELAAQAVRDGFSPIVAAGGDSTINEVVNGMMQAWEERRAEAATEEAEASAGDPAPEAEESPLPPEPPLPPLGILPLGTANDLAANLGLPATLRDALLTVIAGKTRPLDVARCNQRYFVNNSGIGLEPYATYLQATMRGNPRGTTRYLRAALRAVWENPRWTMDIRWDTGRYRGPVTIISVGNGARTGGFFYLTPEADPFDGQLDFALGFFKSRFQAVRHLYMAARPHNALAESTLAYMGRTTELHIISETPTFLHTDGEVFQEQTELHYRLHAGRLPVLVTR